MQRINSLVVALMLASSSVYANNAICCLGGAHIDNIFMFKKSPILENANHAYLKTYIGGVGYNMAHLLKRKFADVEMVSIIGTDIGGDKVIQTLKDEGIDSSNVIRDAMFPTTLYSAFHKPDGGLELAAIDKEIYNKLDAQMLQVIMPKLIHAKAWVLDSAFKPEVYAYLSSVRNKPTTYVTICSIGEINHILPILPNTDYLFGNVDEISAMAQNEDKTEAGIWKSLEVVAQQGVKNTICTNGAAGIYVLANGKRYRMAALPTTIVESTNGAGDALAAGVITSLENNATLEAALHNGLQAAASQLARVDW